MLSTIIVGSIFIAIFGWAVYKSKQSMKDNKCAGCGGSCSASVKASCNQTLKTDKKVTQ